MEKTPDGTPVGVDDPYALAGRCDHLTGDGRCRYALRYAGHDPEFAAERRAEEFDCVAASAEPCSATTSSGCRPRDDEGPDWRDCPHYRSTTDGRECVRCGLEEVRMAHESARPLLEEHHLSYGDAADEDGDPSHEITVALCRWCHTKVHKSFARVDDDASPDPEAIAAREERRGKEMGEYGFASARERYGGADDGGDGDAGD